MNHPLGFNERTITKEQMTKQLRLEQESVTMGVDRYQKAVQKARKNGDTSNLTPENWILRMTIPKLSAAIHQFCQPSRGAQRLQKVKPLLKIIHPDEVAYLVLRHGLNNLITPERPLTSVCITLAKSLVAHYDYVRFKSEHGGFHAVVEKNLKSSHQGHRQRVMNHARRKVGVGDTKLTESMLSSLGAKLIDLLIESTGLFELRRFKFKPEGSKKIQVKNCLQGTKVLLEWLAKTHTECEVLHPIYQPCVIPPKNWETMNEGGYYGNQGYTHVPLVRTRRKEVRNEIEKGNLQPMMDAVNTIQATPWRINTFIMDVMDELIDTGLAGLPMMERDEPDVPKPWTTEEEFQTMKAAKDARYVAYMKAVALTHDRWARETSRRTSILSKLSMAKKFSDEEALWFVWTLDWRGRIYPIAGADLHPQADDTGKALLEFAEAKPLGDRGAYWLAVYGASLMGHDKLPLDERVQWVKDNWSLIKDCALKPLDGSRAWMDADSPFKFLAFCREWIGFKVEGPEFQSRLPISLDGSCNGLQNFSGLLLDAVGGAATNLIPVDKPADIYQEVANVVNQLISHDLKSATGKTLECAKLWEGKVDRGWCKRNVMTKPYGSGEYGFKNQLLEEMRKKDDGRIGSYLGVEDPWDAVAYLAKKNVQAIGMVVVKADEAMDWLQDLARIVTKEAGQSINWTTPIGHSVCQLYTKSKTKRIETYFGGTMINLGHKVDTEKVCSRSAANGLSPNFIHSLDACHLAMTALKCRKEGITNFSFIHDSFGTHACDTDTMNRVLRETFVEMHSEDVLGRFEQEIRSQVSAEVADMIPPRPTRGSLDLAGVLDSVYFFCC